MINDFQRKILQALVDADGEMTLKEIEALYERRGRGGDSIKIAGMNRRGWTAYARRDISGNTTATGLIILNAGRTMLAST